MKTKGNTHFYKKNYFPIEIQDMLSDYNDIIVDDLPNDLPPVRSINHRINLIPGATLPNKETYRMTPTENEEIRK